MSEQIHSPVEPEIWIRIADPETLQCDYCKLKTNELNECCFCEKTKGCEECMPVQDVNFEDLSFVGSWCKECEANLPILKQNV